VLRSSTYPYYTSNYKDLYLLNTSYSFGFNGKEKDKETRTEDYGMRIYDYRLGKFLSVDPIAKEYPWNSTYAFAENNVIRCVDLDGLEKVIYTIVKSKSESGTVLTTVNVKTLDKPGPLGDGAAVVLNRYGKKYYLYGEKSKDLKDFVTHYEGREDKVYPSLEGGAPTGGIGHKLSSSKEQKDYPVGTKLSDETIDKWFKSDWSEKEKLVEKNESTKDLVGGQKEAMVDFVFNGLKASAFEKGSNETFFSGFMKGQGGTLKKRIGQLVLFKDNEKYNLDYVKDKKGKASIEKQVAD